MSRCFYSCGFTAGLLFLLTWNPLYGQNFTEVALDVGISFNYESSNLMGGGMAWFDYDKDGDEDLYLTGGHQQDRLYRNEGNGLFTNVTAAAGNFLQTAFVNTTAVVTGDIDNDGYREILVTTWNQSFSPNNQKNILFYNNGDGTFTDISDDSGLNELKWTMSACFLDINNDALLDIWTGNYISDPEVIFDEQNNPVGFAHTCFDDDLYINNGDLTFTKSNELFGDNNSGCTLAMTATDYDRDGDADMMFVNDFGEWVYANTLLQNQFPDTQVVDVSAVTDSDVGIYGMGVAVGDYDEDLDLDYYFTNIGSNVLLRNDDLFFLNVAEASGVEDTYYGNDFAVGWGTFFFDFDNDSYLDLFVANGYIEAVPFLANTLYQKNKLFKGSGTDSFDDVTTDLLPDNVFMSRGATYCDYDQNGTVDFGVVNVHNTMEIPNEHFTLYQNSETPGNNYISLGLEGTLCNKDAFGTQVELYAGARTFLRELSGGASHCSQNSSLLHFGLGEIASVDSVKVFWPIGASQVEEDLEINQVHWILQDTVTVIVVDPPDTVDQGFPYDPEGEIITSVDSFFHDEISFFPQPVHDVLYIEGISGNLAIELYDLMGRRVCQLASGQIFEEDETKEIHIPDAAVDGMYLCLLKGEHFWKTIILQIRRE